MSIVDKVRELQDEIKKQYGVKAYIQINIFDSDNSHVTKETANYISQEVARLVGKDKVKRYENQKGSNYQWVKLDTLYNFDFAVFYPKE